MNDKLFKQVQASLLQLKINDVFCTTFKSASEDGVSPLVGPSPNIGVHVLQLHELI